MAVKVASDAVKGSLMYLKKAGVDAARRRLRERIKQKMRGVGMMRAMGFKARGGAAAALDKALSRRPFAAPALGNNGGGVGAEAVDTDDSESKVRRRAPSSSQPENLLSP